jgi:hypothetical protein
VKTLVAIVLLVLSAASVNAQVIEDVHADLAAGDYRAALQKISKRLPESKANPSVRYQLLMARGEALVQLKQKSAALDAYRSALSAVRRDGDLNQSLAAQAMIQLLTAGAGWSYKSSDGATFDLIDRESRKKAAAAMLIDQLAKIRPKSERAAAADGLKPMIDLMPHLSAAMAIEYAASGNIQQTGEIIKPLGDHARLLLRREVDRIFLRTTELEDLSNDFIILEDNNIPGRRGLHSDEMQELRGFLTVLDTVTQTSEEGRRINRRLGGTGESWDEVLIAASEVESCVRGVISINAPAGSR